MLRFWKKMFNNKSHHDKVWYSIAYLLTKSFGWSSDLMKTFSPWFTHRPSGPSLLLKKFITLSHRPLDGFDISYKHRYTFRVVRSLSNFNVMLVNAYVLFDHNWKLKKKTNVIIFVNRNFFTIKFKTVKNKSNFIEKL